MRDRMRSEEKDVSSIQREPPFYARFLLAGLSSMVAGFATNPLDVVKVRMQSDNELVSHRGDLNKALTDRYYKGFLRGMVKIVKDEGVLGLYKGVVPSLMRDGFYSGFRLGAYEPVKVLLGATDVAHTPIWKKVIAGAVTGMIGSFLASPADLVKIRLVLSKSPRFQTQRNVAPLPYRNTLHAFRYIYQHQGVVGLWTGVVPTVQRAMILTATQIPVYDHMKHTLLNLGWFQEGLPLHIVSSLSAAVCCALATSPVDVVKTRFMKQNKDLPLYSSGVDCIRKTHRAEGLLGFYKGVIPNFARIGPHTIITFLVFEELRCLADIAPM